MFILNWILDNLHHPWSSVITPYGAWFSYALASYALYVFYLWVSQKPKNAGLHERVRWIEWKNKLPFFGIKSQAMPANIENLTTAERKVYDAYKAAIANGCTPDKKSYDHYLKYVHYAGDTDQKLMTNVSWLVLGILGSLEMAVLVQMLIDILLAGGMSADDAKLYGLIGGLFLGAISAVVVHQAAHAIYKKHKISTAYDEFLTQKGKREDIKQLGIDDKDQVNTGLSDAYQILSRASPTDVTNYGVNSKIPNSVLITFVLILAILVGSFGVRYATYVSQFSEVNCQEEYVDDSDAQEVCKQDNLLKANQKDNGLMPVLTGNALFSVLYVFLLFGLYIYSYKRSFLSANSEKAYKKINGNVSGFDSIKEEIDKAIVSADSIRGLYAEAYAKKRNNDLPDRYFIQYLSEDCSKKNTCDWECVENYLRENKHV